MNSDRRDSAAEVRRNSTPTQTDASRRYSDVEVAHRPEDLDDEDVDAMGTQVRPDDKWEEEE